MIKTTDTFKALRIHQTIKYGQSYTYASMDLISLNELSAGDVVIKVAYSGINYKDALAVSGKGKILRKFPLVAGIDLSGVVLSSTDNRFKLGDKVFVCGALLSEKYDGGYSEYARIRADALMPLSKGLSLFEVMAIGTAGYTAALAIERMENNGQNPKLGDIVVTGASGGVGSFAINMLTQLGYRITASTRNKKHEDYLIKLGAKEVITQLNEQHSTNLLGSVRWGGAIDSLGGETLTNIISTTCCNGNVAAIGLAQGVNLATNVMPFILRGVSLLGINSIEVPTLVRDRVWQRLTNDLKPTALDIIVKEHITFDQIMETMSNYFTDTSAGRTVVEIDNTLN